MLIDGVSLDRPTLGWVHRSTSEPLPSYESDLRSVVREGRDGVVGGIASTTSPTLRRLVVQTPRANLESLVALFRTGRVLTDGTREAAMEFKSMSPTGYGPADAVVDATFVIRLPGAFMRAKTVTTTPTPIAGASVVASVFPGLSAPVADAILRFKGPATGIRITDSSGAWLSLPNVAASTWLRFDMDTGFAFTTETDTWTGGTNVSGLIDFGGPRGVFEITPSLTVLDPANRTGKLTVTTATRTGAVLEVRGKSAHLL